ncbi:MAG: ATP-dependent zinc metalloprotease FtsH [Candidatus Omnitrophica bacterium]|nr:ATP-dependent zinc metalloprotease FtsH [Candidatus Omnitrophota bacterium]MBU2043709.1 ATP-dependent zinc metalloprotease FtsH [Candidatus Omnitrophota bacterium]MBU2474019.1 ATP-dependent zinc metalloprotease FtsH [Candidatus Omnitrophota bacterium]
MIAIFLGLVWISSFFSSDFGGLVKKLTYSEFYYNLEHNLEKPTIKSVKMVESLIQGVFSESSGGGRFYVHVPQKDDELISLLKKNVSEFEIEPPRTFLSNLLFSLGPIIIFIVFLWYFSYKGNQMGSRVWGFGKSRAKLQDKENAVKVTFGDVAGIDEAKAELEEVIEFLKDPKKFQRLGGRFPKGVLLVGPPGCGKTLLAKAVAGEAKVPFYSISGSDFVEMFVGVGASRVRDLFEQAKKSAKMENKGCIIFIDEIDAVGRQRFAGVGGGHDEREQTLNQLLTEMDGFQTEIGIIVMAATNRPDVLDPALLRPGRFDRHIVIYSPDIQGREDILKVHTRKIHLDKKVELKLIAQKTPGFSGADLENLCNEAALLAARRDKNSVEQSELEESIERVIMGPEKKSRIISKREKELTAYHESGHALLSLLIPEVDPLSKVSIIPRGMAGGYTFTPQLEDRWHRSKKELLGTITVLLGGRVSEEVNLGDITTGASDDLIKVTQIARHMICDYGMSQRLGSYTLGQSHGPIFLGRDLVKEKDYSEETAKIIDEETKRITDECYARAKKLITEHKRELKILAEALLEKEVLDAQEVKRLIGFTDENNTRSDKKQKSG